MSDDFASLPYAGRVLGTDESTPLEFWVALAPGQFLQLDDVVALERVLPGGELVRMFGVVSQVRARHEGARFDSDVFLIEDGLLPAEVSEAAKILTTRFEPEVFVPPTPGTLVRKAVGEEREKALFFDNMEKKLAVGLTRDGEPLYVNLEFVDGTRGAHINISGVSGVATKTTYATFLLYSLFRSPELAEWRFKGKGANARALIFNVKDEGLMFLDRENSRLTQEDRENYARLNLAAEPFRQTELWAPPRPRDPDVVAWVDNRQEGVRSFFWTIHKFCTDGLLRYLFTDTDDDRAQYPIIVHNVVSQLNKARMVGDGAAEIDGEVVRTFSQLVDLITERLQSPETREKWAGVAVTPGTIDAFLRRLFGMVPHVRDLVRADVPRPQDHEIAMQGQITVVDLNKLNSRAQRFVVGAVLKQAFEAKERAGSKGLLFVVLDELNKYAPREGYSPIKEVLLDVAERGRSLGIILVGAQQTASEVERRIVSNCSIRVVGRLDTAEAGREEYGFLPAPQRQRATIIKPGTMILSQPELPVPTVLQFPRPSWATAVDEALPAGEEGAVTGDANPASAWMKDG